MAGDPDQKRWKVQIIITVDIEAFNSEAAKEEAADQAWHYLEGRDSNVVDIDIDAEELT